jgi:flavin reductase (DIM6/NTAB) family NADH-FMN oxidoreductase RutF/DNA-binding transcriptional LysR family regulator
VSRSDELSGPHSADPQLRQRFLAGMSHAACTVNVVTTNGPSGQHGVTVSAMASVSADTPKPTLLVCIHHLSSVGDAVLNNGVLCVNLLREDQAHVADTFAGRARARGANKFNCAQWTTQVTGAPRIVDPLVAFDCCVTAVNRVGSHYVIFCSVQDIFIAEQGAPLIYANRAYGVPLCFSRRNSTGEASGDGGEATVSLGCFKTFAPYVVPAVVARMTKAHPDVPLTLVEGDQRAILDGLRREEMDLALIYDFGLGSDVHAELLAELTPYVLLPEGHPLAAAARLPLEALIEEPLILLDIEPSREYFLSLFRDRGIEPHIGFRTASFEMVRGLVGHGLGYSILATKPENSLSYDGRTLITRPLSDVVTNSRLVLAHLVRRPLSASAEVFSDLCRSYFHH